MLRSTLALLLIAPLIAHGADEDPAKVEREKLQGSWIPVKEYKADGDESPSEASTKLDRRITISGETMTNSLSFGRSDTFKIALDPRPALKAIDWIYNSDLPHRLGIYRADGDTLEIAWSYDNWQERPPALAPCPKGSKARWTYSVYRRDTGPSAMTPEQAALAAEAGLEARRRVSVGQAAPDIDGLDLYGKPLKLSDYRGKVVMLVFWGSGCGVCLAHVPHQRELLERFKGKPFAMLGVNCTDERAAALKTVQDLGMNWPSWYDEAEPVGPVAANYHVTHIPSVFVIDAKGIIRATDPLPGFMLDRVLKPLMKEVEQPAP